MFVNKNKVLNFLSWSEEKLQGKNKKISLSMRKS